MSNKHLIELHYGRSGDVLLVNMVRGRPTKAALKNKESLALARKIHLETRKTLASASASTLTPDDNGTENQENNNESSGSDVECTGWSGGIVHCISSDEEPIFISEEEEEVEDLSESELEEVIRRNRERLGGTTTVEWPVVEVVEEWATDEPLVMLEAEQPKAEPGAFSVIMGKRSDQEWKRAESTRSLGYNGQSSRTKRRREKAARDEETEDQKLRDG